MIIRYSNSYVFRIWIVIFCSICTLVMLPGCRKAETKSTETKLDATQILTNANNALLQTQQITYDFTFEGIGEMVNSVPNISGCAMMLGSDTPETTYWKLDTTMLPPGSPADAAPLHIVTSRTPTHSYQLIPEQRTAMQGLRNEGADAILWFSTYGMVREFAIDLPFADEFKADQVTLEEPVEIQGVLCDVVHIIYKDNIAQVRWYIAQSDHLPRGVDRLIFDANGVSKGEVTMRLHNLQLRTDFTPAHFALEIPADYDVSQYSNIDTGHTGSTLLPTGIEAPNWKLIAQNGNIITLESLKGSVVILDFWAAWSPLCHLSMSVMQQLHREYKDVPVVVIGISTLQHDEDDPAQFINDNHLSYELLIDGDHVADTFGVHQVPATFIIGPNGVILFACDGLHSGNEMDARSIINDAVAAVDR